MQLTHKIALCPTLEQAEYFSRACGTARRVWNWALGERNRQYAAGRKPNAMALKKQFNAIKYSDAQWLDENGQPWLKTIHRDAHSQPFAHLAKAWNRFFADIKAGKPAHEPQFKKKGRCRDSFYVANDKLARAISDVGFGMFRSQMEYKAKRYSTRLVIADRWYPSSRLCSVCDWKNKALVLKDREWTCPECGTHHDRDLNAAQNLKRLATATALPVASPSSNGGTVAGMVPATAGKVTPVRYECGQHDTSGQEKNRAHLRALS